MHVVPPQHAETCTSCVVVLVVTFGLVQRFRCIIRMEALAMALACMGTITSTRSRARTYEYQFEYEYDYEVIYQTNSMSWGMPRTRVFTGNDSVPDA